MIGRVLLTGGARSGKSLAAERLLSGMSDVTYVATAPPQHDDREWEERIRRHRDRRPATWTTLETDDLAGVIATRATPQSPVLVDCLTLWLTARMDHHSAWRAPQEATRAVESEIAALADVVSTCPGGLVLVTNEVGSGLVPPDPSARLFRDLLGHTNSAVAERCDDVYLVAAGRFLRLERSPW